MSEPRDWMSELSDLFERLVERTLTADDRIRLNALLAQGVEVRRYYRDYMRLHGALELRIAGPAAGPFDLKSCGSVQSPRCLSAVAAAAATRVPPISTVRQPVAFLHGSFGGAILSYAFAALLMVRECSRHGPGHRGRMASCVPRASKTPCGTRAKSWVRSRE